jgi:hypothetical protein
MCLNGVSALEQLSIMGEHDHCSNEESEPKRPPIRYLIIDLRITFNTLTSAVVCLDHVVSNHFVEDTSLRKDTLVALKLSTRPGDTASAVLLAFNSKCYCKC